jgi:hypothetical protein
MSILMMMMMMIIIIINTIIIIIIIIISIIIVIHVILIVIVIIMLGLEPDYLPNFRGHVLVGFGPQTPMGGVEGISPPLLSQRGLGGAETIFWSPPWCWGLGQQL